MTNIQNNIGWLNNFSFTLKKFSNNKKIPKHWSKYSTPKKEQK